MSHYSQRTTLLVLSIQYFWMTALVCLALLIPHNAMGLEFFAGYGTGTYGLSQAGELGSIDGSVVTPNSGYLRWGSGKNRKDYWYGLDFSYNDITFTSAETSERIVALHMINTGIHFGGMNYYVGLRYKTNMLRYEANNLINIGAYDFLNGTMGIRIIPAKNRSMALLLGMEIGSVLLAKGSASEIASISDPKGFGFMGWGEARLIFGRRREGNLHMGARLEVGYDNLSFTVDETGVNGEVSQVVESTKFLVIFGTEW